MNSVTLFLLRGQKYFFFFFFFNLQLIPVSAAVEICTDMWKNLKSDAGKVQSYRYWKLFVEFLDDDS